MKVKWGNDATASLDKEPYIWHRRVSIGRDINQVYSESKEPVQWVGNGLGNQGSIPDG
jgi:hypothetical protein